MKRGSQVLALTLVALAVALAGCETQRVNESMARVDDTTRQADAMASSLRKQRAALHPSVSFSNDQWVSTKPLAIKKGLPPARDCTVVYNESKTLQQFAQWVSDTCGIAVRVSPDALDNGASYLRNRTSTARTTGPTPITATPSGSGDQLADLFPGYSGGTAGASSNYSGMLSTMAAKVATPLKYSGRLSGLLDTETGSLGLSWRYDHDTGEITIFYLETRQFEVYAFNKGYNFNSEVKSGMSSTAGVSSSGQSSTSSGTGVSGQSGSNQTTNTFMSSALLDDIQNNVRSMLTLDQMAFSKSTGTFSITDRPDVLNRIQQYLDAENAKITKQILINVSVVSVTLTDRSQYGVDWSLVYKSVSGNWGFGLTNTVAGIDSSAINGSISILDTSSSPWAGSKSIIQALSQQGRVSSYQSPSVTTLNLQTAPIQIGNVKGYLASSQTSLSSNVGSTTALNAGSITSGFNMSLVPKVIPDDQLLMQIAINMSSKPTFDNITSGGSTIQAPNYDLQIFDQSVKLRSGQTLVLSGFDQNTENATKSGVGNSSFWGLGGGGSADTNRTIVVLMITPIILE
jgi:type IVB pilus formation R64 PilN family outer membrane protein